MYLFFQELRNTGDNRFNCFLHDFNLCKTCVEKNLKWTKQIAQKSPNNITVLRKKNQAQDIIHNVTSEVPKRPLRIKVNKSVDRRSSAESKSAVESADAKEKSAETLTDVKITEDSAETLVDAKATEDAFTNIETIPEEPENSDPKNEKWSRSKSYAHAIES